MQATRSLTLMLVAALGIAAAQTATAAGQEYPSRPIRLIIPNAAGAAVDTLGRILANTLTQVSGNGHHLTVILVLQPLENYRGIQTTGIRQDNLLYVRHSITPRACTEKPAILPAAPADLQWRDRYWRQSDRIKWFFCFRKRLLVPSLRATLLLERRELPVPLQRVAQPPVHGTTGW